MITIFDTLFILALDEEAGGLRETVAETLESVLAGAVLAELVLWKRVELNEDRLVVTDPAPTEHLIMDRALYEIHETARSRKLRYWINTLVFEEYLEEIGHNLVVRGVLFRRKKRLYLALKDGESTGEKGSIQDRIKSRLREITLGDEQPELSEIVLLAFLYHADLLKIAFERGERKKARKRIVKLINDEYEVSILGETLDTMVTMSCK